MRPYGLLELFREELSSAFALLDTLRVLAP
jgi:hypothetical protein